MLLPMMSLHLKVTKKNRQKYAIDFLVHTKQTLVILSLFTLNSQLKNLLKLFWLFMSKLYQNNILLLLFMDWSMSIWIYLLMKRFYQLLMICILTLAILGTLGFCLMENQPYKMPKSFMNWLKIFINIFNEK